MNLEDPYGRGEGEELIGHAHQYVNGVCLICGNDQELDSFLEEDEEDDDDIGEIDASDHDPGEDE